MNTSLIKEALVSIRYYLDKQQQRKAVLMFLMVFLSSFLDIFGLASIVPVILAASKPGYVFTNEYFVKLNSYLGFTSEQAYLIFLICAIFAFFVLKTLFLIFISYKQSSFVSGIGKKIIDMQFIKYCNVPYWELTKIGSAKVNNQILAIPYSYVSQIIRPTFAFFTELLNIGIIILAIFIYNPILVLLLAAILGPSSYLLYSSIRKRAGQIGVEMNRLKPISYSIIADAFLGYIEMKLASKEPYFRGKLVVNSRSQQDLSEKQYLYSLLPNKVMELVAILGVVTIFLYAILMKNSAGIITMIGLFAAASYRLMPSINRLLAAMLSIKGAQYTIDSLKNFREYEEKEFNIKSAPINFNKNIVFENLGFAFPETDKKVLNRINLEIKKGEKIGFIGVSGSGKSTLMSVLLRFYTEDSGKILIDGVPLSGDNTASWRQKIGYVKQDVFIMNASIRENIVLGDNEYDAEQLQFAIEKASLSDFIQQLPDGINTVLSERGANLSGGQRQRIGIARALYRNSDILVLDEATSALDNETEKDVTQAIDNLSDIKKTILIVAHRITTLKQCDRIYELRDGEIIGIHQYENIIKSYIE